VLRNALGLANEILPLFCVDLAVDQRRQRLELLFRTEHDVL
jgi:hypothetical protein